MQHRRPSCIDASKELLQSFGVTAISSCIAPGDGSFAIEFKDEAAVEAHGKLELRGGGFLHLGVAGAG